MAAAYDLRLILGTYSPLFRAQSGAQSDITKELIIVTLSPQKITAKISFAISGAGFDILNCLYLPPLLLGLFLIFSEK